MSGSEVQGCVELVTAAFHDAAITAGRLSKKNKTAKGHADQRNALLFQALNDASKRLQDSYDEGYESFGSAYQLGDNEARTSLLAIAVDTNAKITQTLQTAIDNEFVDLDMAKLYEAAINYRHDAICALTDLHHRLELILPISNFSRFSPDSSTDDLTRVVSRGRRSPPSPTAQAADVKNGLRRLLSTSNAMTRRRGRSQEAKAARRRTTAHIHHDSSHPLPLNIPPVVTKFDANQAGAHQQPESPSSSKPKNRQSMLRKKSSASNLDSDESNLPSSSSTKAQATRVSTVPASIAHNDGGISLLMEYDPEISPLDEVADSTVNDCLDMFAPPVQHPVRASRDWTPVAPLPPVPPPRRRPPVQGIAHMSAPIPPAPPLKLVTTQAFGHSGRANVISPIAELDDSISVTSKDYDKDSVYSLPMDDSTESNLETPTSTSTAPTSNASDPATPKSDRASDDYEPRSFLRSSLDSGLDDADRSRDASPSDVSSNDAEPQLMPPPRMLRTRKSFVAAPQANANPTLPTRERPVHAAEPLTVDASRPVWHKRAPTADSGYSSAGSNGYDTGNTIPIINNTGVPVYPHHAPFQSPPVRPVRPISTINDIDVITANAPRPVTRGQDVPPQSAMSYEFPSTTFGSKANASFVSAAETRPVPMEQAPPKAAALDKKSRWNLMRELRDQKSTPQTGAAVRAAKEAKEKERERTNMIRNKAMADTFGF